MIASFLSAVVLLSSSADTTHAPLGIAIEHRLAIAAHLNVGDTVQVLASPGAIGRAARVDAIYQPRPDPSTIMRRDWHIRLHLAQLATLLGEPDRVDRIGIALKPGVNPDSAATWLNRTAFGFDVTSSSVIASRSSATFVVVSRFHRAIAIISVLASAIFLLCLMLLKVDARRRDVAVLRFTGISRRTIFVSLVLEAAVISLAGSVAGIGLAIAAGAVVNGYYQHAYDTALIFSRITVGTVAFAVTLSILLGIGAGSVAAWRLVRVAPVTLWSRAA